MPWPHALVGVEGGYLAQRAGVDDLLYLPVKGGEPQHEADHHAALEAGCHALDLQDLAHARGDGFLQQHVIAGLQGARQSS